MGSIRTQQFLAARIATQLSRLRIAQQERFRPCARYAWPKSNDSQAICDRLSCHSRLLSASLADDEYHAAESE